MLLVSTKTQWCNHLVVVVVGEYAQVAMETSCEVVRGAMSQNHFCTPTLKYCRVVVESTSLMLVPYVRRCPDDCKPSINKMMVEKKMAKLLSVRGESVHYFDTGIQRLGIL